MMSIANSAALCRAVRVNFSVTYLVCWVTVVLPTADVVGGVWRLVAVVVRKIACVVCALPQAVQRVADWGVILEAPRQQYALLPVQHQHNTMLALPMSWNVIVPFWAAKIDWKDRA